MFPSRTQQSPAKSSLSFLEMETVCAASWARTIAKSFQTHWNQAWKMFKNDLAKSFRCVGMSWVWDTNPKPGGLWGRTHPNGWVGQANPRFTPHLLLGPACMSSSITKEALRADSTWPKRVIHLIYQGGWGLWLPSFWRHWKVWCCG